MGYEEPDDKAPAPARAYVYAGNWVADCPRPGVEPRELDGSRPSQTGCGNVEFLYKPNRPGGPRVLRDPIFSCSNCGHQAVIDWPKHEHELLAVLMNRPVPQTRNWYPQDHPVAVNFRLPHGQTVRDLVDENEEHGVK